MSEQQQQLDLNASNQLKRQKLDEYQDTSNQVISPVVQLDEKIAHSSQSNEIGTINRNNDQIALNLKNDQAMISQLNEDLKKNDSDKELLINEAKSEKKEKESVIDQVEASKGELSCPEDVQEMNDLSDQIPKEEAKEIIKTIGQQDTAYNKQEIMNQEAQEDLSIGEKMKSLIQEDEWKTFYINANVYQIAMINKMLPKAFKFDIHEVVKRQTEIHLKKTSGLANFAKKPEIKNEYKQQKIFQKYNQKRIKEQQRLEQKQQLLIQEKNLLNQQISSPQISDKNDQQLFDSMRKLSYLMTFDNERHCYDSPKLGYHVFSVDKIDFDQKQHLKGKYAKNKVEHAELNDNMLKKTKSDKFVVINNAKSSINQRQNIALEKSLSVPPMSKKGKKKGAQENAEANEAEEFQQKLVDIGIANDLNDRVARIDSNQAPQQNQFDSMIDLQSKINQNKAQVAKEEEIKVSDQPVVPEKKKRGRKPGSTKKPKVDVENQVEEMVGQNQNALGRKSKSRLSDSKDEVNMEESEPEMLPFQPQKGSIFSDVDMKRFNIYDKYYKLLVSIVTHEELYKLTEVPLFLKVPTEDTKFYRELQNENDGLGYLNFNMILQRLKSKKYGPGRNMIKEDSLQKNIRNVFKMCQKYYNYDALSMRISKILEEHFERELANSPDLRPQCQQSSSKIDLLAGVRDKNCLKKLGKEEQVNESLGKKRSYRDSPQEIYDDNDSEYSEEIVDKRRKRDKKKDKKDKKDKKKKDKRHSKDARGGDGSSKDRDEEEDSEDEQLRIKQQLFDDITNHLNIEQKKGIIPIVFEMSKNDPKSQLQQQQTFEFDLFSLASKTCKRLQQYVKDCIAKNQDVDTSKNQLIQALQETSNQDQNKLITDQIQNQIDAKLRENKMNENGEGADDSNIQLKKDQGPIFQDDNDPSPYQEDRYVLIQKIGKLDNKQLRGIVPIVKEFQTCDDQEDEQKLEFDLYELPDKKCKELHNYVEKCLLQNKEAEEKAEQQKEIKEQLQKMMEQQPLNSQELLEQQLRYQQQLQQQIYDHQQQNMPQQQQLDMNNHILDSAQNPYGTGQAALQAQINQIQQQQQQSSMPNQNQQALLQQQQNLQALQEQLGAQINQTNAEIQPQDQQQFDPSTMQMMQQIAQNQQISQQQMIQQNVNEQHQLPQNSNNSTQQQLLSQTLQNNPLPGSSCSNQVQQYLQQQIAQQPNGEAPKNEAKQISEQNDREERLQLVKSIKQLDKDVLDLLGFVMSSKEYQDLDEEDPNQKEKKQQENDSGQRTIELDIQTLSINKIKFLRNFVENPQAQMQYRQQLMIDQTQNQKQDQQPGQNTNATPIGNPKADTNGNDQDLEAKRNAEAQAQAHQQILVQVQVQLEQQVTQLQETQIMIQELSQIQQTGQQLSMEQQRQLQQLVINEQVLSSNIIQLQQYQVEQQQAFQQQQQNLLGQQQIEQQPAQPQQNEAVGVSPNDANQNQKGTAQAGQEQNQAEVQVDKVQVAEIKPENAEILQSNNEIMAQGNIQGNSGEVEAQKNSVNNLEEVIKNNDGGPSNAIIGNNSLNAAPDIQQQDSSQQLQQRNERDSNQQLEQNQQQIMNTNSGQQEQKKDQQIDQTINQLIYQYQFTQQELEQKIQLSNQLQTLFVQLNQQQSQLQGEELKTLESQMQQIQEQLIQIQAQVQELVQNHQNYEQQILTLQQQIQQGETNTEQPQQPEQNQDQKANAQQIQQQQNVSEQIKQQQQQQLLMQLQQQQIMQNQNNEAEMNGNAIAQQNNQEHLIQNAQAAQQQQATEILQAQNQQQLTQTPFNTQIDLQQLQPVHQDKEEGEGTEQNEQK